MNYFDYIIVGLGLAGIAFCEQLRKNNKTFTVVDDGSRNSSEVAAGVYNPVILKRFTASWKADEQMQLLEDHYASIEKLIDCKINYHIPVLRKFNSIEEQNNWFAASDNSNLEHYMSLDLLENSNPKINAPLGFGMVNKTGRINTKKMIGCYAEYLLANGNYAKEKFDYDSVQINANYVKYRDVQAKCIVFCEGFGLKHNPFFKELPLVGNKGEVLIIKSSDLKLDAIIKSSNFLVPLGDDLYYVGATYNWQDKDYNKTETSKEELIKKLEQLVSCEYKIIEHKVAIRPTTVDRRPLVGRHKDYNRLVVLNGLGTRGVMISPYIAQNLYHHLENNEPLFPEIDIKRFD